MSLLIANCPRCGAAHTTFDVTAVLLVLKQHGWQHVYEAFGICRHCAKSTTFMIWEKPNTSGMFEQKSPLDAVKGSLNGFFEVDGYISLKDHGVIQPPEHLP